MNIKISDLKQRNDTLVTVSTWEERIAFMVAIGIPDNKHDHYRTKSSYPHNIGINLTFKNKSKLNYPTIPFSDIDFEMHKVYIHGSGFSFSKKIKDNFYVGEKVKLKDISCLKQDDYFHTSNFNLGIKPCIPFISEDTVEHLSKYVDKILTVSRGSDPSSYALYVVEDDWYPYQMSWLESVDK